METMPQISIALASFNGERYIHEQIDSILSQSFQDFELIISDDGSKDATPKIICDYAKKDRRIKPILNQQNLGFKRNFERAIRNCNGNFVALSDQDDVWYPNHLEVLLKNIGESDLCAGDADMVDENNVARGETLSFADGVHLVPPMHKIIWRLMFIQNPLQGASMLLRRDFLDKVLPIPDGVPTHDRYFTACATCHKGAVYIQQPITRYRQHGNNVTALCHNKQGKKIIPLAKILTFISGSFRPQTDRILLCKRLTALFGENVEVQEILRINEAFQKKKIRYADIKALWDNYEFITTRSGHQEFLKYLLIWYFARQIQPGSEIRTLK